MISTDLESFLTSLRQAEQAHSMAQAEEQAQNDATQDILHALELEKQSYHQLAGLARELSQVRQKRRAAKDTVCRTEPVVAWLEANRPVVKSLERLLGELRKVEKRLENRVYIPRTRKEERAYDDDQRGDRG